MADSLGIWLRRTREAHQMDLEDVEQALRIRRRYLQALEMGDYEALPGAIQARGFLRNYARFLGLPVEDALARYDAEARGVPVQPRELEVAPPSRTGVRTWAPPPPTADEERRSVRANTSSSLMRILVAALVFFGLIAAGSLLWLQFSGNRPVDTPMPTVRATEARTVNSTATPTSQATPVFPISEDDAVRLRLVPTNHAWISVSADEQVVFQGVAEPEQAIEAVADEIAIVTTGNAGAFRLYVNGTDWGALGDRGEVVRRAWTPEGETSLEGD
ncbi:MAG: helix-turn-helix domain-containing protein [Anaerolineae bacterium]